MSAAVRIVRADEVLWEELRRRVGWRLLRCPLCDYRVRRGPPHSAFSLRSHVVAKHFCRGSSTTDWRWRFHHAVARLTPKERVFAIPQASWHKVLSVMAIVVQSALQYKGKTEGGFADPIDAADIAVAVDHLLARPEPWYERVRNVPSPPQISLPEMRLEAGEDPGSWVKRLVAGAVPDDRSVLPSALDAAIDDVDAINTMCLCDDELLNYLCPVHADRALRAAERRLENP